MKLTPILFFLCLSTSFYGQDKAVFYVKDIASNNKLLLNFYTIPTIFESDVVNYQKISEIEKLSDSTYRVTVSGIKQPLLLLRMGGQPFSSAVLVKPGDSLHVVISDPLQGSKFNQMIYYGQGANSYNSSKLTDAYGLSVNYPKTITSYRKLLEYAQLLQEKRDSLIQTYVIPNDKNQLPLVLKKTSQAMLLSDLKNGISALNIKLLASDVEHLIAKITVLQLQQDEKVVSILYYIKAMRDGLNLLNSLENPENSFTKKMDMINTYFSGRIRSFLLSDAYYRYSLNTSGDTASTHMGNTWYLKHKNKLTNQSYNNYIDFTYALVNKVKKPWPKEIAEIRLYDKTNRLINFEQLLLKYNGRAIVLDHWATWCGPCITEFTDGKRVVEQLKSKGLKFLYISIDKASAIDKMDKLASEYQLESYRIDDNDVETYKRYLNLTSIPRYVLLNEKGILMHIAMPRPSEESEFRQKLNRYLAAPAVK